MLNMGKYHRNAFLSTSYVDSSNCSAYIPRMPESFYDHQKVAKLRESMGLSRQEMADALGVSLMTIYRVEHYHVKRGGCSIELLAKIALLLGVPMVALLYSAEKIVKNFRSQSTLSVDTLNV